MRPTPSRSLHIQRLGRALRPEHTRWRLAALAAAFLRETELALTTGVA